MVQAKERTATVGDGLVRPLVVFDGGNRSISWLDAQGNARNVPAYVKELDPWDDCQFDENSVVVGMGDRRFVVGETAKYLQGTPVHLVEKSDVTWQIVLIALEPNAGCNVLTVDKLRVLCTNSNSPKYREAAAHLQSLAWLPQDRTITRNGQRVSIGSIRKVELIDEGTPAWRYATAHKLWKMPQANNGVLDIGGNDASARLFTPNGTIIRGKADLILPATSELARMISGALTNMREFQFTPDLGAVMDAIANQTYSLQIPGSFEQYDFKPVFERCRFQWVQTLRETIKQAWQPYWNELGEVLIVGGSAPLFNGVIDPRSGNVWNVEEATNGRFKIATSDTTPNFFQLINLYGMAI